MQDDYMDSMGAFMKGIASRGNPMTYFDGVRIKELMIDNRVTKAIIWLRGDRGYTQTTVELINNILIAESIGVSGSTWATPMTEIDGNNYDVGTPDKERMIIEWK